jgi:hypothetical protein
MVVQTGAVRFHTVVHPPPIVSSDHLQQRRRQHFLYSKNVGG